MSDLIFITGGVVSSLGKGITAASLGALLAARGIDVTLVKLDPYINVDPGTMSPQEHGEVFVTHDGAETDLDLGHYERFVGKMMNKSSNFTSGQVYNEVIRRERKGDYLGGTIQVIPHITDAIKKRIERAAGQAEIAIIEIGGTVGDIESAPFLEAIRQLALERGRGHTMFLHVTLLPKISPSDELKTKPTQHSVKELRSCGINPDCIICRSEQQLPLEAKQKIALFCHVEEQAVISIPDADTVYAVPGMLHIERLDQLVIEHFHLSASPPELDDWQQVVHTWRHLKYPIKIAVIAKYNAGKDAYLSLSEAMVHAGIKNNCKLHIEYIDAESVLLDNAAIILKGYHGIVIPGGFGQRGIEGKIAAIHYARENHLPCLGICLGMQLMMIEFSRHVLGLNQANSTEFEPQTPYPVVSLVQEWTDDQGNHQQVAQSDLGGTMRLGAQRCVLTSGSKIAEIYQTDHIEERHRHRYEINLNLIAKKLDSSNLKTTGFSEKYHLLEVIELDGHPWFIGCQFHPEFLSSPKKSHPLFQSFILACFDHNQRSLS